MSQISEKTQEVLNSLRRNKEGTSGQWGEVYLDNAIPTGMGRHEFAGHLSALKKEGLYKSNDDGFFGRVLLEQGA